MALNDRWFALAELAERWHCSEEVVRKNRARWGLKGHRIGKKLIFTQTEVEAVERRWEEESRQRRERTAA